MPMDEAQKRRVHKLYQDSKDLLESLTDQLPEDKVKQLQTFSFVGEWAELVESICAILIKRDIMVTAAQRDQLAAVLEQFSRPRDPIYRCINDPVATIEALTVAE